ncbi:MAG: ribose 5-phosphate isomerase B [Dehalococcoidia bacterium]|jgi:ribose 5-phosphate isomerase B|nr:ribose 5-phosphate isomerase B [Dehalococcoidia bacterium]
MRLHVAIAADHGGFNLKQELIRRLADSLDIVDKGADLYDASDDYPDYVEKVGRAVAAGEVDRGIIICGSGVGACIAANKMPGIRACVCHDTYSAHQGVEHDDMNVLCLGARVVGVEVATELAVAFLMARFSGEERHRRRLEKVAALERERLHPRDEDEDEAFDELEDEPVENGSDGALEEPENELEDEEDEDEDLEDDEK